MPLNEGDLIRIFEATRLVSSTLRLSDLLATVMRLAGEVVRAEASSILLMDPVTEELYFDIALGAKGEALQQVRLKKGEGIAGWVVSMRRAALVNDVAKDPRWTQKADKTSKFQTRSILAVPMQVKEKLVGVMEAINRADGQPFTEMDQKILEMFAAQAAIAIENARLFESVRQEKEKMSTVLGEMTEAALLLDANRKVQLSNAVARRLFGRECVGIHWSDIEKEFTSTPPWTEAMEQTHQTSIEMVRKMEPPLILEALLKPLHDDKGKLHQWLVIVSDVTEERREAQLKRGFLALVSHKLKTPLVSIRGFVPMLLEKPEELQPFQKTALETIDRNSQLLTALVDKITWFTALESEHLELTRKPHPVFTILDTALADLANFLKTSEAVIVRDASIDSAPAILVDKTWMKEAFRNLIENAVKFNPKKPREVRLSVESSEKEIRLIFRDNGPGIPSEEHEKIFQKFYQIDRSFTGQIPGMGLGLTLVQRVAEAHGGRVSVESSMGNGSTFIITLPLA